MSGGLGASSPRKILKIMIARVLILVYFLIFYRTSKSDIKIFFEHVLHGDDLGGVHRIMQKLQS